MQFTKILPRITVAGAILFASAMYVAELMHSPLVVPEIADEQKYIEAYINDHSPDIEKERQLAKAYWLRYEDVRTDKHWGEKAPMGIWGPRDHFMLHGRREGRILQPLVVPDDMELEKKIAELYWQRYPNVRSSDIWGEQSTLGILGPRDHYSYIGKFRKLHWGLDQPQKKLLPSTLDKNKD